MIEPRDRRGDNGFRGLLKGRFRAGDALGEKRVLGWRQLGIYIFNRRNAKKEIPVSTIFA